MKNPMIAIPPAPLEVWGGIECTRNRVGDRYIDQLSISGHERRIDDLEAIASSASLRCGTR